MPETDQKDYARRFLRGGRETGPIKNFGLPSSCAMFDAGFAVGQILGILLFPVIVVAVIALVRLVVTRSGSKAKRTFTLPWAWGVGVGLMGLSLLGQLMGG